MSKCVFSPPRQRRQVPEVPGCGSLLGAGHFAVEISMVFDVDSRFLQLEPRTFAISAGRKLAAFDAGNFMLSRVPWVMRHSVNT